MFLPALTVAIALSPVVIRSLRASMLNVLGAEYITTARSKGVPNRRLFLRHVLRNAVIPAVTVLGINIGFLIGGTVIIENVFAIPGIGQLMLNSIFERDFPVVQGVTLVFAVMVVLRQPARGHRLRDARPESAVRAVSALSFPEHPATFRSRPSRQRRGAGAAGTASPR